MEEVQKIFEECNSEISGRIERKFDTIDAAVERIQVEEDVDSNKKEETTPSIYNSETETRYYDFSNKKRGVALIFNHVNFKMGREWKRNGSKKDCDDLIRVLKKYEFDVRDFHDQTEKEIKSILFDVSEEDHSNNDCFMCVVMTHGEKDGFLLAYDKKYQSKDLWEYFVGSNCRTLIGKPKLFFIQACRGELADPGVQVQRPMKRDAIDSAAFTEDAQKIPTMSDLLIMYSTSEGYYSFRNETYGSWFIQSLVTELEKSECDDLMTILTSVNRRVAFEYVSNTNNIKYDACKQMPNVLYMLTKTLYFTKKIPKGILKK